MKNGRKTFEYVVYYKSRSIQKDEALERVFQISVADMENQTHRLYVHNGSL